MARNPPWNRDELVLALELYRRFGMLDDRHEEVVQLSAVLNELARFQMHPDAARFRNPNGVAMKLANFAALDPAYPGTALSRGGRLDREIWTEFQDKPWLLQREAQAIRDRVGAPGDSANEAPKAAAVTALIEGLQHSSDGGQGFLPSAEQRRAIEERAMAAAKEHYERLEWKVTDVSPDESFDLLCEKPGQNPLHVEVKGTTGDGSRILLTPNEVEHARGQHPDVALVVVATIGLQHINGHWVANGGYLRVADPWRVQDSELRPVGYVLSFG